jgi:hypothetical protein
MVGQGHKHLMNCAPLMLPGWQSCQCPFHACSLLSPAHLAPHAALDWVLYSNLKSQIPADPVTHPPANKNHIRSYRAERGEASATGLHAGLTLAPHSSCSHPAPKAKHNSRNVSSPFSVTSIGKDGCASELFRRGVSCTAFQTSCLPNACWNQAVGQRVSLHTATFDLVGSSPGRAGQVVD